MNNEQCSKTSDKLLCSSIEKSNDKKMLLVGDSHSRVLLNPFLEHQRIRKTFSAYFSSNDGCYFFDPRVVPKLELSSMDGCSKHNLLLTNWISKNDPELIIIAVRSTILTSIPDHIGDRSDFYKVETASFDKLLKAFSGKIIIVTPNPEFLQGTVIQQLLNLRVGLDRTDLLDRNWTENYALANKGRVSIVDSTQAICGLQECQRTTLMDLYFDNDHLNLDGAEKVFAVIKKNPNFQAITS